MPKKSWGGEPTGGLWREPATPPPVKRGHWRRALGRYEGWMGLNLALVALEQKLSELGQTRNFELIVQIERLMTECGVHLSGVKQVSPPVAQEITEYLSQVKSYLDALAAKME